MLNYRMVLYTDDMEPITVLELPSTALAYLRERGRCRIRVLEPLRLTLPAATHETIKFRDVELWVEKFTCNGSPHWFLFTRDDENALLLKAAFLPGQRKELNDQKANAYARGFLKTISELGLRND